MGEDEEAKKRRRKRKNNKKGKDLRRWKYSDKNRSMHKRGEYGRMIKERRRH